VLEFMNGEWIEQHINACSIGNSGTGKTHLAIALGVAACQQGGAFLYGGGVGEPARGCRRGRFGSRCRSQSFLVRE
jgi:hypothetical protein